MLTIDLGQVQATVADPCDVSTTARLARRLVAEPDFDHAVRRLALAEARRITSRNLDLVEAELRVRAEGTRIYVDVDVEGGLRPAASAAGDT